MYREICSSISSGDPGIMGSQPGMTFEFSVIKGPEANIKCGPDSLSRQQDLPGQCPDIATPEHGQVSGSDGKRTSQVISECQGLRIRGLRRIGAGFTLPTPPPAKWQQGHGNPD